MSLEEAQTTGRIPLTQLSREHVATLAALYDATTFQRIEQLGLQPGWRCWEAGAGSGSVPRWLADRVGPLGHVLATDIDITNLEADECEGIEIKQHDLTLDPAPPGGYDLVHARLVLDHIRQREAALDTMTSALTDGGWLLVECADAELQPLACPDEIGPAQVLANEVRQAIWSLNAPRGRTPFGRTLPRVLRDAGLDEVRAEVRFPLGGPDAARLQRLLVQWASAAVIAAGLLTREQVEQHLADAASGELDLAIFPVVTAWGRKPAQGPGR